MLQPGGSAQAGEGKRDAFPPSLPIIAGPGEERDAVCNLPLGTEASGMPHGSCDLAIPCRDGGCDFQSLPPLGLSRLGCDALRCPEQ